MKFHELHWPLSTFKLPPIPPSLHQPASFPLFQKRRFWRKLNNFAKNYIMIVEIYYVTFAIIYILWCIFQSVLTWRIYRSIGISNIHMYHEYNIVWFNVVVHARILWFFTASRYGAAIYFDIKFLARGFPQRSCYRNGATVLSCSNLDCLKPLT